MKIYQTLGGEPWCFFLSDIKSLTREEVFEVYISPAKETDDDGNEIDPQAVSMTHREQAFFSLQGAGIPWLEAERRYQEWMIRNK